jgi:hypothetical protein
VVGEPGQHLGGVAAKLVEASKGKVQVLLLPKRPAAPARGLMF